MSLREMLENNFDAAETGKLDVPAEVDIEVSEPDDIVAENEKELPERDEQGRFTKDQPEVDLVAQENTVQETEPQPAYTLQKPTTFKKEYLPIWEKMASGQQLTPEESIKFAEYAGNIRENEFKKGVSTYKAEADNARSLVEAISPFIPELQKQNIHPAAWINNLGRAHMILSTAPMDQKVQLFHRLAADYGIQLNPEAGQYPQQSTDPYAQQLMQQIQQMNQEVSTIKGRYEAEENNRLMNEITAFASNKEQYPYFEEAREQMAQLLEKGLATDLKSAYEQAVFMDKNLREKQIEQMFKSNQQQVSKAKQVAKAKAVAVSPRSVTPNGVVATSDKKDRRSLLSEQIDSALGSRV